MSVKIILGFGLFAGIAMIVWGIYSIIAGKVIVKGYGGQESFWYSTYYRDKNPIMFWFSVITYITIGIMIIGAFIAYPKLDKHRLNLKTQVMDTESLQKD